MTVFMQVTRDRFELPVCVADSREELARLCGVTLSTICKGLRRRWDGLPSKWVAVKIEENEDE